METTKIVEILKQVDINLLLKQNILKAVLADLLYEHETERKILNTINNSVNVVDKLYKCKNKLLEYQSIKNELLSYGLNESTVDWAINIWLGVLNINKVDNTQDQFIKFSTGGSFTLAVLASQKIYAWGNNRWGQLGFGTVIDSVKPIEITKYFHLKPEEKVANIYASFRSSNLLTTEGRLFAWGNNEFGQLGDNSTNNHNIPIEVTSKLGLVYGEKISQMTTGGFHTLLVTSLGRVFSWGYNEYGQLGDGTNIYKNVPVEITKMFNLMNDEEIENLGAGLGHSMLTTSLGRIFTWGNNEYSQLGDNTSNKRNHPSDISKFINYKKDEKIKKISLGSLHTFIVTTIGRVFAFGNNDNGQLGDIATKTCVKPIDITERFNTLPDEIIINIIAGRNYSLALTSLGRIFSWGNNNNGQLGIASYITGSTGPLEITDKIVNNDEEWIVNIFSGATSTHSYAVSSNRKIYAWGNNEQGQIGEGTTVEKSLPFE